MTPRMYVSGIVQYNSTSTSLGSNLRFRWDIGRAASSSSSTPTTTTPIRGRRDALRNRALVVKVNRLFRP